MQGRKYEGKYLNYRKHELGIYTWQDGQKYLWQQHGDGVYEIQQS